MTKIVYNACYGGFGLSDKAMQRYAEIKGWQYRKDNVADTSWSYPMVIDQNGNEYSDFDLENNRTDPVLVQVIEELGRRANGFAADLRIAELKTGTLYRIDEYDGNESVMTQNDYDWKVA